MSNLVDVNRWRRVGWPRIVIYVFSVILTIHLFRSFSISNTSSPILSNDITQDTELVHDFPWYKEEGHPRLTHFQNSKHTTTNLSTEARQKLTEDMISKSQIAVKDEFSEIIGIPGSVFAGDAKGAYKFRSLVDCWTTGEWVAAPFLNYVMPHFQDPLYGSCDRKYAKQQGTGHRDAVRYIWKSTCNADVEIDAANWCKALRGRHLLLVGDLVQYQLHELFLDTLRDGPAVCFGELNCKDHTVCEEPESRLRYLRNDILSVRRKMNLNHGHPKAAVIEWPFTNSALMRGYTIVILNRAPVIESDEKFIEGLIETLRTMRQGNPNSLVIYRSTGIGHPFCNDATGPLDKPLTDEQLRLLPFGWSEVSRRNEIARVIVEAAGGVYLDLAKLTDTRPDGHIGGQDCLRYCIPGPLDSWAKILYQLFLGLEGQLPHA